MGLSFRKSASFGRLKFNFSSSGFSFGVKGARIRVGKSGTYVTLGTNGIYYRQRIDSPIREAVSPPVPETTEVRHSLTTRNFDNLTDVDSEAFIAELESKSRRKPYFRMLGLYPSILALFVLLCFLTATVGVDKRFRLIFKIVKAGVNIRSSPSSSSAVVGKALKNDTLSLVSIDSASGWVKVVASAAPYRAGFVRGDLGVVNKILIRQRAIHRWEGHPWFKLYVFMLAIVLVVLWCRYIRRVDKKRMTIELYYTMKDNLGDLHAKFIEFFSQFSASHRIWQKLDTHAVDDRRYHAGASELISRTSLRAISRSKLPTPFFKTNVDVPHIGLQGTELYFFPERLVIKRRDRCAALFYKNIQVTGSDVRFLETDSLPTDAEVVDRSWLYITKNGGRDMRFGNNREVPVCRYSEYVIESDNGLYEVIMTSRHGAMDNFASFIRTIGDYQRRAAQVPAQV